MNSNMHKTSFGALREIKARPLWQYDYGQKMQFVGIELPETYEVHFSNTPHGEATTSIGDTSGVDIPDIYLTTGQPVYAWIFLHNGESDGATEYMVTIPVKRRAKPTDAAPTPVQHDVITVAIAKLNDAVQRSEAAVGSSEESAQRAAHSANEAAGSASDAAESERIVVEAKEDAQTAADDANTYMVEACGYKDNAAASASAAAESAAAAHESEDAAASSAEEAAEVVDSYRRTLDKAVRDISELQVTADDLESRVDTLEGNVSTIQIDLSGMVNGGFVENNALWLTHDGEVVAGPFEGIGGGGGGGGGSYNNAVLEFKNHSGWMTKTVALNAECIMTVEWSSLEDNIPTGNGTMQISVNNAVKALYEVAQGQLNINLAPYLATGSNTVRLTVTDTYGNARSVGCTVSVVGLYITSSFDATVAYEGEINYAYVPTGAIEKTVHFILDGNEIGTATMKTSGRQQSFIIPAQSHGMHTFRVYFDGFVDSQPVQSNELYYELICIESGNTTPIITSTYSGGEVEQFTSISIPYIVYDPASLQASIALYAGDEQITTLTVDRTQQTWTYRPTEVGQLTLTVICGSTRKPFAITVTETSMDVEPVTNDLALYLSSYGRSNREAEPATWEYEGISVQFDGFNWTSDGWQLDDDGITALRVSGDARLVIPYKVFEQDFRTTGKTIEIEFATRYVLDYDAVILSCMNGGRGLNLTAQKATMTSEQTEISTQYKEDEHVRLSFVVEKRAENRLIYCYINGINSGVIQYPADDDFQQVTPANISIGSNDCTMDIYCIRVYDNDLTRQQILDNWIADTQDTEQKVARYRHNAVYDEYGSVVIEKLPNDLPYLVIRASELPQYKGDKKTISGRYVNPATPNKSFTFENAQGDVQGTSSQYYARKNYKIKFRGGFTLPDGSTAKNYQLADGEIPVNVFTFKADVASSEGANNVELARLYNSACPYKTPAQEVDSRVQQGIDGYPCVLFWDNGTNTVFLGKYNFNIDKGAEDFFGFRTGDESWEIKNNTGNRVLWKSADYDGAAWQNDFEARYPDTDPPYVDPSQLREFAEWIVQTDTTRATGNDLPEPVTYIVDVTETVEHVDPDTGAISYEEVTTKQEVTFDKDTAEYRLAKFRDELEKYVELDSALFYYLFTELFLMVDSRAKNAFPSFIGAELIGG